MTEEMSDSSPRNRSPSIVEADAVDAHVRVLYITVSMPFGPHEAFFVPEVKEMVRQGCELLIVPRSPSGGIVNRDAETLAPLSLPRPLLSAEILASALGELLRHPLRALKGLGLVSHSRNLRTLLKNLAVFPKALWVAKVARNRRAQHIHSQWALTTATVALLASEITGIPWSCTIHRGDIVDDNLLGAKLRRASFARFIAKDGIASAESLCGRPLPGNVVLLHSCVDMPAKVAVHDTISDPPVLICPAYLIERKGQRYLIEAVQLLHASGLEVRVWFAGDGEMRSALEALVAARGLGSQVSFLGQVDHAKLTEMFRTKQVDAVVLPTLHEGIPAALIEPMGHGIPVISTNVGGVPELLHDGAGLMVSPRDPAALADAIRRLVGDARLRRQLAEAGRRRVEEGWAVETVVASLLSHISAAVAHRARQGRREDPV